MRKSERIFRWGAVCLGGLLSIATVIMLISRGSTDRLLLAIVTPAMVLIPEMAERLLKCRINTVVYVVCVFYATGPLLGHCWGLYQTTVWWDKMLHFCGGVMFAILGVFIYKLLVPTEKSTGIPVIVFALCFSISVSVIWEFFEYGADCYLGMDMQNDTIVTDITSYLIGENRDVGSIKGIQTVSLNGGEHILDGYIDIGLHDTMKDMLVETVGAFATCVMQYIFWNKGSLITSKIEN